MFHDLDLEVHPEADIVLGVALCADLGGTRPAGGGVLRRAADLALTEPRLRTTAPELGAGRLSIHGGAYAEMSHVPFTRAVALASGGGGPRAAATAQACMEPTVVRGPVRYGTRWRPDQQSVPAPGRVGRAQTSLPACADRRRAYFTLTIW